VSERDWQDRKCWDCKFAIVYGRLQQQEIKQCRRHPPVHVHRQPGEVVLSSAYPDVTIRRACAEFRK
jgi:hypothetical protein